MEWLGITPESEASFNIWLNLTQAGLIQHTVTLREVVEKWSFAVRLAANKEANKLLTYFSFEIWLFDNQNIFNNICASTFAHLCKRAEMCASAGVEAQKLVSRRAGQCSEIAGKHSSWFVAFPWCRSLWFAHSGGKVVHCLLCKNQLHMYTIMQTNKDVSKHLKGQSGLLVTTVRLC